MSTLALIAAITLVHAATQQECTFDNMDQAETFLKGVEDPEQWDMKQPETEAAQAADDGAVVAADANVHIKADNLTDATVALDDLIKPVANIEPSAGL